MAKEFNIHTYPTFFLLLLIMLIPFALSVDDIMNNHQSNMKIIFLISAFIIIILVYGLVKTRKRKIVINELGLLITEKERNMKISWEEISHIFFVQHHFGTIYKNNIYQSKRSFNYLLWKKQFVECQFLSFPDSHISVFT